MIQQTDVGVEDVAADTYTDPSVFAAIAAGEDWADSTVDPTTIDWPKRRQAALIPFAVVDGRPVNPLAPTGIRYGRNRLGHWGEALAADALVTAYLYGERHIAMIRRDDGNGAALPGGGANPGETAQQTALRELREEAGLTADDLADAKVVTGRAQVVADPRASDEAWMVTTVTYADYGDVGDLPTLTAGDDAEAAAWFPATDYEELVDAVEAEWGVPLFAAHTALLEAYLDHGPDTDAAALLAARHEGYDTGWADAEKHVGGTLYPELDWPPEDRDGLTLLDPPDRTAIAREITKLLTRDHIGTDRPVALTANEAGVATLIIGATARTWPAISEALAGFDTDLDDLTGLNA